MVFVWLNIKDRILKQRLAERLLHLNMSDLNEYFQYLRKESREEAMLLDLVTINETSFFRNPRQFLYLTEHIVPELEADRSKKMNLFQRSGEVFPSSKMWGMRVLCAGCSTGEEPYSVAMALFAALRYPRAWDIDILAGDLSESCILTATAGYYEADRLKGLPAPYIDRYMKKFERGAVVIDEIKNLIKFCRLNLNDTINGKASAGIWKCHGTLRHDFLQKCTHLFFTRNATAVSRYAVPPARSRRLPVYRRRRAAPSVYSRIRNST